MENYMTDDQIIDFIKKYINKTSYNYAVLIDGSWGAGKTYFIENKLIPVLKEEEKSKLDHIKDYKLKKIIYVSLYGIESKEELIKQMFIETLPFSNLIKNKKFEVVSGLSKSIFAGALSFAGITLPDKMIDNDNLVSLENCILIFDDLERCNMNINEILGYINNFVEHDGIKVIIAANEKEINTSRNTLNKELKYLMAINENILFPEEKNENPFNFTNSYGRNNSGNNTKINVKELDRRINYLFGEDEIYKLIKEKLIGVTIYYRPEVTSIIEELVNKNKINEEINEIILSNKEFIKSKFDFYKHNNIRTLLFAIDKFESLIEKIKPEIEIIDYRKVINEIFKYFIVISIIYKSGKPFYKWEDDSEIKVIPLTDSSNMRDYIKSFKFVDEFISSNIFNIKKAVDIIIRENEILKAESLDSSDPLYKLNIGWWYMEDETAEEMIKIIVEQLRDNPKNYSTVNYSSILYHIINLHKIGICRVDVKNVIKIMSSNLKSLKINNNFNVFGYPPSFNEEDDVLIYSEAIKELNEKMKFFQEKTKENEFKDILKNVNEWTIKLSEYAHKNRNEILLQKAFLSKFNIDELIEALKGSNNEEISTFRGIAKHTIYYFNNINEYYQADKNTIEKIIKELETYLDQIKYKQKIRTVNFQFLINDLKDIYQKLNVTDSSNIK